MSLFACVSSIQLLDWPQSQRIGEPYLKIKWIKRDLMNLFILFTLIFFPLFHAWNVVRVKKRSICVRMKNKRFFKLNASKYIVRVNRISTAIFIFLWIILLHHLIAAFLRTRLFHLVSLSWRIISLLVFLFRHFE